MFRRACGMTVQRHSHAFIFLLTPHKPGCAMVSTPVLFVCLFKDCTWRNLETCLNLKVVALGIRARSEEHQKLLLYVKTDSVWVSGIPDHVFCTSPRSTWVSFCSCVTSLSPSLYARLLALQVPGQSHFVPKTSQVHLPAVNLPPLLLSMALFLHICTCPPRSYLWPVCRFPHLLQLTVVYTSSHPVICTGKGAPRTPRCVLRLYVFVGTQRWARWVLSR